MLPPKNRDSMQNKTCGAPKPRKSAHHIRANVRKDTVGAFNFKVVKEYNCSHQMGKANVGEAFFMTAKIISIVLDILIMASFSEVFITYAYNKYN